MRRTRTSAFLLATAVWAACVASMRPPDPVASGDVRPPVLGYRLLLDGATGEHVLVHDGREVVRGDRADCERVLVARLEEEHGTGNVNAPLPTLGGVQFWSDLYWHAGWRIQENLVTGHCRLLEPSGTRRAWGTHAECRTAFEGIRLEQQLDAPGGELVVLVHGLGRSRASMASMEDALREEGYATFRLTYASTRGSLEEHARRLRHLLEQLEGVERVSFVTHSMGGIVVRELFRVESSWTERVPLGRIVMLAPPNRGSALGRMLSGTGAYEWVLGESAEELASRKIEALPLPPCPTGIIAGGDGGDGRNPLLEGDDDGVVAVAETRLDGAADFLLVDSIHTFIMNRPEVQRATVRFLREGRFGE